MDVLFLKHLWFYITGGERPSILVLKTKLEELESEFKLTPNRGSTNMERLRAIEIIVAEQLQFYESFNPEVNIPPEKKNESAIKNKTTTGASDHSTSAGNIPREKKNESAIKNKTMAGASNHSTSAGNTITVQAVANTGEMNTAPAKKDSKFGHLR